MLYRDRHADFTAATPCQQVDCRRRSILRRPLDRQGCKVKLGLSSRRPAVGHNRPLAEGGFRVGCQEPIFSKHCMTNRPVQVLGCVALLAGVVISTLGQRAVRRKHFRRIRHEVLVFDPARWVWSTRDFNADEHRMWRRYQFGGAAIVMLGFFLIVNFRE